MVLPLDASSLSSTVERDVSPDPPDQALKPRFPPVSPPGVDSRRGFITIAHKS
jgi:hypothetical protein